MIRSGGWVIAVAMLAGNVGQAQETGAGRATITVVPERPGTAVTVSTATVKVRVNGRAAEVKTVREGRSDASPLELVLLIDGEARTSFATQLNDIAQFVRELPAHTKVVIGYMQNGRAVLGRGFTADPEEALKELRIPSGVAGSNGSPYFCLSDLAKNWPSHDAGARREVLMISDGVDGYSPGLTLDDPYVETAIKDAVRAHVVADSIFWTSRGGGGGGGIGESLLLEVTDATGGESYWQGIGNPVALAPYLNQLHRRLENQWVLEFRTELSKRPKMETFKVQLEGPGKVTAPHQVWVDESPRD